MNKWLRPWTPKEMGKRMLFYAVLGIIGTLLLVLLQVSQASAFECAPKDNTARILAGPNPNALHKDWRGENTIGLSWSLHGRSVVQDNVFGQLYVVGDLISPRGGVINKNVFILKNEWRCK